MHETLVFQIISMVVFGGICAAVASSRGRHPLGWFAIGALTGCIGLIILLAIGDLKQERSRQQRMEHENRRLREMIRLDRQVADQRHVETERRLGAHDRALGVDTAPPPELLPRAAKVEPLAEINYADVAWFYGADGAPQGPVHFDLLRRLWKEGRLKPEQYVWCQNFKDWQPLSALPGLCEALNAG